MKQLPHLLSEVEFGAFLAYSPRGCSAISRGSRTIRDAVKHDTPGFLKMAVGRLLEELPQTGLGKEALPCLSRVWPVAKSAFAARGERASVQVHFESMAMEPSLIAPATITVVDDFVTKGATLLAAASLVKDAFPAATARVFAAVRTMGLVPDVEEIVAPCTGSIRREGLVVYRDP